MQRDPNFYSELKQLNDDLFKYFQEAHTKSPYYDFSPTFKDYIEQFNSLDKKYGTNQPFMFSFTAQTNKNVNTNEIKNTEEAQPPPEPKSQPFLFSFNKPTINNDITNQSKNTEEAQPPPEPKSQPFLFSFTKPTINNDNTNEIKNTEEAQPPTEPKNQPFVFSLTNQTNNNDITNQSNDTEDAPPPEPKIDKYEEQNAKHAVKCKLYEKGKTAEIPFKLLGLGYLYVKEMETPNKYQVIFRQEPDLRRVLLNEVVTPNIPVKLLPKAVQMVFPESAATGASKFYLAKLKDENDAKTIYDVLNLKNKGSIF